MGFLTLNFLNMSENIKRENDEVPILTLLNTFSLFLLNTLAL